MTKILAALTASVALSTAGSIEEMKAVVHEKDGKSLPLSLDKDRRIQNSRPGAPVSYTHLTLPTMLMV